MIRAGRSGARVRAGGIRVLTVPVAAVGAAALVGVVVPVGRGTVPVASRLDLAVLLLAVATAPALVEPAGPVADATPTGRLARRAGRLAVSLGVAVVALGVVRLAAPPAPGTSSTGSAFAELALHIGLVAAVGAVASRWRPEAVASVAAAAVGVLAGTGPKLAGLDGWSLDSADLGSGLLVSLAATATLVYGLASRDPAAG